MTEAAVWRPPPVTAPRPVQLTKRESQVLSALCLGLSNKEIADGLWLTEHTIKNHAKTLFRKLGARDRAHAVALAVSGQVHITIRPTTGEFS